LANQVHASINGTMANFKGGQNDESPRLMTEAYNIGMVHRRGAEDTESRVLIKEHSELSVLGISVMNSLLSIGCGAAALVSLAQILQRLQCFRIVGGERKDFAILLFCFSDLA
jgi:hypothetical protein